MKTKKIFLSAAIAGLMASGSAVATWTTFPAASLKVANTAQTSVTAAVSIPPLTYTLDNGTAINDQDYIIISLSGGATFGLAAIPAVSQDAAAAAKGSLVFIGANNTGGFGITAATPIGNSTLIYRYIGPAGAALDGLATPLLSDKIMIDTSIAGAINLSNVPDNGTVAISMSAVDDANTNITVFTAIPTAAPGNSVLFQKKDYVTTTVLNLDEDTLRAASTYKAFNDTGTSFLDTADYPVIRLVANPIWDIPATGISPNRLLVTIEGDFSGIESVKLSGDPTGGNATILNNAAALILTGSDAAGATAGGVIATLKISADKTKAYGVNNTAIPPNFGTRDIRLNFTLDGTTSQPARIFSARADVLPGDPNHDSGPLFPLTPIYTLERNGSFFSSNSFGPLNKIKITEHANVNAGITMMAYKKDGTLVTQVPGQVVNTHTIPSDVAANSTVVIWGDVAAAAFPGGHRFDFIVNSSDVQASNIKREPTGSNITTFRTLNATRDGQEGAI